MLKKITIITFSSFIYFACSIFAQAEIVHASIYQSEQDKARKEALSPRDQDYKSSIAPSSREIINFPHEKQCKYIQHINIESENNNLTKKLLGKIINQAKNRCMGVASIKLLAQTLQNELIVRGYVTSLIDVPTQSLEDGTLSLTLSYGKIGHIAWDDQQENDKTRLWNAFPTREGEILVVPDLEQGMANLQRTPGSSAHMQIMPGREINASDLILTRKAKDRWQIGAWLDDAGSRTSGRYQGGGALYLYNPTSLNDVLYVARGGDVEYNQHDNGNKNKSLYYSVPFGYWSVSVYAAYSHYLQQLKGRWSTTDYVSKNRYYSASLSRLLSHTQTQKTTLESTIFKSTSHYFFGDSELSIMRKQNPGWRISLQHQHYFDKKIVDVSLGLQNRLAWLSSTPTPEEKARMYSHHARVFNIDAQSLMKFRMTGDKFAWAPAIKVQLSPDELSSDNKFNIGSRWSVRGFDGERSLSGNQGWYWRNDFIWDLSLPDQQLYVGLDMGKVIGKQKYYSGNTLSGAVSGLRGKILATQYDLFMGSPLVKPGNFMTDKFNLGFSLQWRY